MVSSPCPLLPRITPRKFDVVPACDPQSPAIVTSDLSNHGNLTLSKRGTRTSLTFRKIRFTPCDCGELPCVWGIYCVYVCVSDK